MSQYPRGIPYRAPEAVEDWIGRLRLWTFLLLGAAALLLAVTVGAAIYWANRPALEPQGEPNQEGDYKAKVAPAAPPPATRHSERVLACVAGLGLAHLYQNFLNIGLLADGVENETYTQAEGEEMLNKVLSLMDMVDGDLKGLKDAGLSKDDRAAVEHLRAISVQLRAQADALRTYWSSGDLDQAALYHKARNEVWDSLTNLPSTQAKTP